jgi:hypothetical protein
MLAFLFLAIGHPADIFLRAGYGILLIKDLCNNQFAYFNLN